MAYTYVVAVMGVTGAGKSTFIKLVTGNPNVKVGRTLCSETSRVTGYDTKINDRHYVLVDTPGFDDTSLSDSEVLEMITDWLASSYRQGTKLSAIIYIHPINQARMQGSALRNLAIFKQLCGEKFFKNITLATSCWSLVTQDEALGREQEFISNDKFWKPMITLGSSVKRIPDSAQAARDLVYSAAKENGLPLQVQTEIVDRRMRFDQLTATQCSHIMLEQLRRKQAATKRLILQQHRIAEETQRRRAEALQRQAHEARQARINHYSTIRMLCKVKKPFGTCDRYGCAAKLKHWDTVYHCSSCYANDNFWHCGSCGNKCENSEHPPMTVLDCSSSCRVM